MRHDLPGVGGNLQDHLDLFVISECTGDHTYDGVAKLHRTIWAGVQYVLFKTGPVASSLFETGGFWYADPEARSPDIQFHLGLGSGIEAGVERLKNAGVTLNSAYLHPRSRGTVQLSSADPSAAPLIDPNYWSDPHDKVMSLEGLKIAREIMQQAALKPYVLAERLPGPKVSDRRAALRLRLRECQDRPPSCRHLQDGDGAGSCCRSRSQGPWSRGASRVRFVGHAASSILQYQRTDHYGWRTRLRPYPGTAAVAGSDLCSRAQRNATESEGNRQLDRVSGLRTFRME